MTRSLRKEMVVRVFALTVRKLSYNVLPDCLLLLSPTHH